jgi:hypothetical protein
MPLTAKGEEIMGAMHSTYKDPKVAKRVFYASRNAGKITGVDPASSHGKFAKRKKK